MTTIVRAADAAPFLSLVPQLVGYRPSRSLVLIPFTGSRSLGAMRFDLPESRDVDDLGRTAATVMGMICRIPDADAVACVAYTDASLSDGIPHAALAQALEDRADECGLRLTDALCVGADGWGSYLDLDLPAGGRPLEDLDAPETERHLEVAEGDQSTGSHLPPADLAERERVGRALLALDAAVRVICGPDAASGRASRGPAGGRSAKKSSAHERSLESDPAPDEMLAARIDPQALEALCLLDDLPALFEEALMWDADALSPYEAAALVWCLARPALRDVALVGWCGGLDAGDDALDAQLRWESGEEYPTRLAMQMWGEGERPDPDRLEHALALVRRAAAAAPASHRAGALATAAWLSWALGRSTHAESYAVRACESEPEHGLAEIVRSFVAAGHLPDWAFRRPGSDR